MSSPDNILLLGGTTEAREIADVLSHCAKTRTTVSLAGRTTLRASYACPVRVGGFGGVEGLVAYLRENDIKLVINATHPFATQMRANAVAACEITQLPLVNLDRPKWEPEAEDSWTIVASTEDALERLKKRRPSHVFVPFGQKEAAKLEAVKKHRYLIRSIEKIAPRPALPRAKYVESRPPFDKASEVALMKKHAIDVVVVKNSGAAAVYAKILAARELGIEVIMIDRPPLASPLSCHSVAQVMSVVIHELGHREKRVA
jgi:precorrin-6A/cobalt-precorrin-6A reductase